MRSVKTKAILMLGAIIAALAAAPVAALTDAAPNGRELYQGTRTFQAGKAATSNNLPQAFAACARCHGATGAGNREGGVMAPSVRWAALTQPRNGLPPFASRAAVGQAITIGVGRNGSGLNPVMPRFNLTGAEADALVDYLARVGTVADSPPGVTANRVLLGTALPLSGPGRAVGARVLAGMRDVFETINAGGGVHGRHIDLIALDRTAVGPEGAAMALIRYGIHAVVGAMLAPDDGAADRQFALARIAHIASLTFHARSEDINEWTADLLPPLAAQQRLLRTEAGECAGPAGLGWAIAIAPDANADPQDSTRWFEDAAGLKAALATAPVKGCAVFGSNHLPALASALPAGWDGRLIFPVPAALLEPDASRAPPDVWFQLGRAAARLAVELLSRAGAALHEQSMLAELANLGSYEPLPGAGVKFARNRRHAWDPSAIEFVPASQRASTRHEGG